MYQDFIDDLSHGLPRILHPSTQTYEHLAEHIINEVLMNQCPTSTTPLWLLRLLMPHLPIRPDRLGQALALVLHKRLPTNTLLKPLMLYLDGADFENGDSEFHRASRLYGTLCANLLGQRPSLALQIGDVVPSDITYTRGQKLFLELRGQLQGLFTKLFCCQNSGRVYVVINVSSLSSAVQDTIDTLSRVVGSTDAQVTLIILIKPSLQGEFSFFPSEPQIFLPPLYTFQLNVADMPKAQSALDKDISDWLVNDPALDRLFLTKERQSQAFWILKKAESWLEVDEFLLYLQQSPKPANTQLPLLQSELTSSTLLTKAAKFHGRWLLVALMWIYHAKRPLTLDELDDLVNFDISKMWKFVTVEDLLSCGLIPIGFTVRGDRGSSLVKLHGIAGDLIRLLPGTILIDNGRIFPVAGRIRQWFQDSAILDMVGASSAQVFVLKSCLQRVLFQLAVFTSYSIADKNPDKKGLLSWWPFPPEKFMQHVSKQYASKLWNEHYLEYLPLKVSSESYDDEAYMVDSYDSLHYVAITYLNCLTGVGPGARGYHLIKGSAGIDDVKVYVDIEVSPELLVLKLKISTFRAAQLSAILVNRLDTWNSDYDSLLLEAVYSHDYFLYKSLCRFLEENGKSCRKETIAQALSMSYPPLTSLFGRTPQEVFFSLEPSITLYHVVSRNSNILDLITKSPEKRDYVAYLVVTATRLGDLLLVERVLTTIKYHKNYNSSDNSELELALNGEVIFVAVASERVEVLRKLLDVSSSANVYTESGMTALMLGSQNGLASVVELLLEREGNNINERNRNTGDTALHLASRGGFFRTVAVLLTPNYGANLLVRNLKDDLPLHLAVAHGHLEVAMLLIDSMLRPDKRTPIHMPLEATLEVSMQPSGPSPDSDADTNTSDSDEECALDSDEEHSDKNQESKVEEQEVGWSGSLDIRGSMGQTPCVLASRKGLVDLCKAMVAKGADPTLVDSSGMSALHHAAKVGSLDLVRFLLHHPLDCDLEDFYHRTPLYYASELGHLAVVEDLLEHNDGLMGRLDDENQLPPLQVAIMQRHQRVVEFLVKRCKKTAETLSGLSMALHTASKRGDTSVVECLIDHGADINATDLFGNTALHMAAYFDRVHVVELLVMRKANLDCPDKEGFTPLMDATRRGSLSSLKVLIFAGANMEALTYSGLCPIDLAIDHNQVDAGRFLMNKLIQRNTVWNRLSNGSLRSLLKFAIQHLNSELAKSILYDVVGTDSTSEKFSASSTKDFICSILWDRWLAVLKLLWDNWDASKLHLGEYGTALHYAAMRHQTSIVQTILSHPKHSIERDSGASKLGTPLQAAIFTIPKSYEATAFCDTMQLLLDHGADPKVAGDAISHALQVAVYNQHVKVVKSLLDKLPEKDALRTGGEYGTILQAFLSGSKSCQGNDEEMHGLFHLTLKHTPSETVTRPAGCGDLTALHIAAQSAPLYLVKLVMQQPGAQEGIAQIDRMGRLPVHLAAWSRERTVGRDVWDIIQILDPALKTLWKRDKSKRSVLHVAAARGNLEVLENILEVAKKINPESDNRAIRVLMNKKDVDGWTALHWACRLPGNDKVVKWLIDNEADAKKRTSGNWLPRHVAIYHGCRFLDILKTERRQRPKGNDWSADLDDTRELPIEAANDLGYFCDSCFCVS